MSDSLDNLSIKLLSNLTIFSKYSKYLKSLLRRETWEEICFRNRNMHLAKYPNLYQEILDVYKYYVVPKKVLPSMRSMQFAGKPIEINPSRIFNCCFLPIDNYKSFSEVMFLLLGGTGVGYSVQKMHIEKLPEIKKPIKTRRFLIEDSITGWSNAVNMLISSFLLGKSLPIFDFSDIRAKGADLITTGGKAPGPEPLKTCLFNIQRVLDRKNTGDKLFTLEVHDIICFIADAVLTGGIRRAALISLFDLDDTDMLTCKFGNWWEENPQRARSNNSAVIVRHKITKSVFIELWEKIKASGSGEPGFYFTNNPEWGTNPCVETALRPYQFCNLCEINATDITSQEEFEARAKAAAFLGTLQAGYTDFHYLRDIWKKTTEKDALLGIGLTGIASGSIFSLNASKAAKICVEENKRVATAIGINPASRITCIKPSGTASLVVGSSSGIHAWYAPYYVRRIRFGKNESIYKYLVANCPEIVEDDFLKPDSQAVVSIPVKAPEKSIFRDESPIQLLERVKRFSNEWVKPGHIKGDNSHNISATISIKEDEWNEVGEWMWNNKEVYNGLSVLPYFGGSYKQTPFEDITEEQFKEMSAKLKDIDFSKIIEDNDDTNLTDQAACAGGQCEI